MGQSNFAYGEPPPCTTSDEFILRAHQDVVDAVDSAEISKSHGELIAILRPEVQARAIQGLRCAPLLPGVAELITSIESLAVPLETAAFDKTDCSKCSYNSSNHQGHFKITVRSGLCVNAECASTKQAEAIFQRKQELEPKYRVIALQVDSPQEVTVDMVGSGQHEECTKRCSKFGAVLSGKPGEPIQARVNVCTDGECHSRTVEAHRTAELNAFRTKVWKHAAKKHYHAMSELQKRGVLVAMLAAGWAPGTAVKAALGRQEEDLPALLSHFVESTKEQVVEAMGTLALGLIDAALPHQVGALLRELKVQLQQHWVLTPKFLERLSVEEIDAIGRDLRVEQTARLVDARATKDRKVYAEKLGELLTREICVGYVPAVLRY